MTMNLRYFLILLWAFPLGGIAGQSKTETKQIILADNVTMEFVSIAAGTFAMGSAPTEQDRQGDEGPVFEATISRPFYLGQYEVTQGQWVAIMGTNPSVFKDKENWADYPVDRESWEDCIRFIEKLNALGVGRFRLPTEAEWEYACKLGEKKRYYWGDDPSYSEINAHAWIYPRAEGRSQPVGQKKGSAWGLYDMCGNVWEWCQDWKGKYPAQPQVDYQGPAKGEDRIFRGGSWFNLDKTARCANRNAHIPDEPYTNIGLRLVMEIP